LKDKESVDLPVVHIDYAISPQSHTPMYLMHKYWARKPHNVVAEYIQHYSKENEVVLDPFCGSGVTIAEALRYRRRTLGIDLDPIATFITWITIVPANLARFKKEYEQIKKDVKEEIEFLYLTRCPKCGHETPFHHIVYNKDVPIAIHLRCRNCKSVLDKKFDEEDKKKAEEIESKEIPFWYPTNELIWNSRVNVSKGMRVSNLFSKRNLVALSILYNRIEKIDDNPTQDLMKFTFSSMLPQASKLLVYTEGQGPGWKVRGFWIPEVRYEMNVWHFFHNRYEKTVEGKEDSNSVLDEFVSAKTVQIFNQSSTDLSNIPDGSVDYVFTDPPYGDSIPYLELDYIYASWLKFEVNFKDEIIISDSPVRQDKNFDMYYKLLARAFREIYRVLKDGKWLTVTFHNTDIKIYNAIIQATVLAGFDLEKIVYQPPARVSAKAQLAPYASAKGDYYIRFRKTRRESVGLAAYSEIDKERYERMIVNTVKHIMAEHGEPIPYSTILNSYPIIYEELKKSGYLFSAPEGIEDILKRNIDREFVLVDVKNEKGKVIGQKWWLKGAFFLDRVPLSERVEAVTMNLLNRELKVTFDEVLKEVYLAFTNALTPDTESIKEALMRYAERTKDGKWGLKPDIRLRENQHDIMVEKIAIIGKKAGFRVYADLPAWRERIELNLPPDNLERIREIDVVWYNENGITHEFEVENTTGITEAVVRGSNILSLKTKRYIVIPEERQEFFYRKISEPMLQEKIDEFGWLFMFYDALISFYNEKEQSKTISVLEFEKIATVPKPKLVGQKTISQFTEKI